MAKAKKPVMTFSELVYAIQNRGKSMNLKESKPMKLAKEEKQAEPEQIVKEVTEPVEEAVKSKKATSYAEWRKRGSPGGGWTPPDHNAPIKSAKNIPSVKKK